MKIKDKAIKELETLQPAELLVAYELILSLKGKLTERIKKECPAAYMKVRQALSGCKGSLSKDIVTAREERI